MDNSSWRHLYTPKGASNIQTESHDYLAGDGYYYSSSKLESYFKVLLGGSIFMVQPNWWRSTSWKIVTP